MENIYPLVILPLLIFSARVIDVSMQTIRIQFVSKGFKYLAPLIGFFEVLVWILAMGQIMQNLNNVFCYLAYAGGFATGSYVGILIETKLAIGCVGIRIITNKNATVLIENLRRAGFGVTDIDAHGEQGPVSVIHLIIKRTSLQEIITLIKKFNPNAFYTVEDVRFVSRGVFPLPPTRSFFLNGIKHSQQRKGK